jgi:CRISPR/Cas system CSM-associated protein Csm3 (group 7 of RAMP superfamily)
MAAGLRQRTERAKHRYLSERIIVTGVLELTSPAHFGNGDADELTDMPLLVDEVDGRAVITGASLAGALRNYLRDWQWGYDLAMPSSDPLSADYRAGISAESDLLATKLFGAHRGDDLGDQSPLIVDDALSVENGMPDIELRDGVKICNATGTAEDQKKYDYQLLRAGARFGLRFELLLDTDKKLTDEENKTVNAERKAALALALDGLGKAEIRLGMKKRRGFGRCQVTKWNVRSYRLKNRADLMAWLVDGYAERDEAKPDSQWRRPAPTAGISADIFTLLGVDAGLFDGSEDLYSDRRSTFKIDADFKIDGSLMVRGGFDEQDRGPDSVHLSTRRHGNKTALPILPGTSAAGAIRHRALRIARTVATNNETAQALINRIFGADEIKSGDEPRASRLTVDEQIIDGSGRADLVQTRIKIDRFTGGTIEAALLDEAPHFGGNIKLKLSLRNPKDAEVGLLLLVVKDLWLGDLTLGGEASIGRGRVSGVSATLWLAAKDMVTITQSEHGRGLVFSNAGDSERLESYVAAFNLWAEGKSDLGN